MYRIGAHLSRAGGINQAVERIHAIEGNCLQIFSSSPRSWLTFPVSDEDKKLYFEKRQKLDVNPVYFHASYLINLADSERIGSFSVKNLIDELTLAETLNISGSIIHLGSLKTTDVELKPEKDYETLIKNIRTILANTPESVKFIAENAGNRKLCNKIEELAYIINAVNSPRVKVCIDTCHLFAAGYDLSTQTAFDAFFDEFDKIIGLDRLEVFQINDSKDPRGSNRDRHENIGEGYIPLSTFHLLLNDPRTKDIPFILETPGFDKTGPDLKNIRRFNELISSDKLV